MKVVCAPIDRSFGPEHSADLEVVLFSHADRPERGAVGAGIISALRRGKLRPDPRAWDLLSLALSVTAADLGVRRNRSPDGWTREINLQVAVSDPSFWDGCRSLLEAQLRFLTTDRWTINFADGGASPSSPLRVVQPEEDCVSLLSGGLDSLVGAIDLVGRHGKRPYLVSQVAQGDKRRQARFASRIGGGLRHLQLNHNAKCPGQHERSQRARSIVFLAYGVLLATALRRHADGDEVPLFVCENGFISVNPPLTTGRLGSLSTRTAHPVFLIQFQRLLDIAGLRVRITNPYEFVTKGEMLTGCDDQPLLEALAHTSTSCGRFSRTGYQHCGRCVPCIIRRASFQEWRGTDRTTYRYADLSLDDADHARFDDVRSAAMAVAQVSTRGFDRWLGASLCSTLIDDTTPYREVVRRGIDELGRFLKVAEVM